MKILHVVESFAGGVYSAVKTLAKEQEKHGEEVYVCHSFREDSPESSEVEKDFPGIEIFSFEKKASTPQNIPLFGVFLRKVVKNIAPDVIHLHSTYAGFIGRTFLKNTQQQKIFYSPHGWAFLKQDISKRARKIFCDVEKRLASRCQKIICVSDSERTIALKKLRLSPGKIEILHNGVDVEKLPHKEISTKPPLTIGTSARVTYAKAPWVWQEVANELKDEANFLWIGDRDCSEGWIEPDTNITFTGWLKKSDDILEHLKTVDIYLSTSVWEGLPIAVIEAQGMGIPAVVTKVTGNDDVVENDVTGFVCEAKGDIVQKLKILMHNVPLREKFSRAARKRVSEEFSQKDLYEKSLAIYAA